MKQERVAKMLKLCRRYLNWIQNSVFEGELSDFQLKELKAHAAKIMRKTEDSLIIFSTRQNHQMEKEIIGLERGSVDQFL